MSWRKVLPNTMPATKAAINPLPCRCSASTNARKAAQINTTPAAGSAMPSRDSDQSIAFARHQPTPIPVKGPKVSCNITLIAKLSVPWPAAAPVDARIAPSNTNGRAKPSLRPLSTLIVWLRCFGTSGLETTACPNAASVGVKTAAVSNASASPEAGLTI